MFDVAIKGTNHLSSHIVAYTLSHPGNDRDEVRQSISSLIISHDTSLKRGILIAFPYISWSESEVPDLLKSSLVMR